MINWCIQNPLERAVLEPDDPKLTALESDIAYLAGDQGTTKKELEIIKGEWVEEVWGDKQYFETVKKEIIGS